MPQDFSKFGYFSPWGDGEDAKTYIPNNSKLHGTQFMPKKPHMKNIIVEATQV